MKKLVWTVCALALSTGMSSLYAVSLSEEPAKNDTVPAPAELAIAMVDTATTDTVNIVAIAEEPAKDESGDKKDEPSKEEPSSEENTFSVFIA